jgi:hypothetical protein
MSDGVFLPILQQMSDVHKLAIKKVAEKNVTFSTKNTNKK